MDAPCSSIGTIRRHPEIFFRKKIPNFNKIKLIQKQLLEKAKFLVKKNGILIYMICSFFYEEGIMQINDFLKENKNFSQINFSSNKLKYTKKFIIKYISQKISLLLIYKIYYFFFYFIHFKIVFIFNMIKTH